MNMHVSNKKIPFHEQFICLMQKECTIMLDDTFLTAWINFNKFYVTLLYITLHILNYLKNHIKLSSSNLTPFIKHYAWVA